MQPSSEACEIEDRCFRVSVARRLMLPHPAAANPADVVQFFPQQKCRRIISYTSYLRTNDCTNNGYVTDMLEHNTMINIDTAAHMILHNTQS